MIGYLKTSCFVKMRSLRESWQRGRGRGRARGGAQTGPTHCPGEKGGWGGGGVKFTAYMRRFPEKTKCLQQFKDFLLSWGIKAQYIFWW